MPKHSVNTSPKQRRRRGAPISSARSHSNMFFELDSDGEIIAPEPSDLRPREQEGVNQLVIEISSDEESSVDSSSSNRQTLKAALDENQTLKDSLTKIRAESISLDSQRMYMTCDICFEIMLSPYIISQCGHSFCANCLQTWFRAAKKEHRAGRIGLWDDSIISEETRSFRILTSLPEYSCPSCRFKVTVPPVQNYALTKLITSISNAAGASVDEAVNNETRVSSSWDEFFRGNWS